ncbi:MAG TPA: PAS domain S-box protein, partial [Dehalococcoidia bacterium]|nr:PAS domain S-box protein [Dehalococcoidia bacterium]
MNRRTRGTAPASSEPSNRSGVRRSDAASIDAPPLTGAQTRAILEATLDGVVVADANGRIVTLNSQAEAMFGYRRDELRGKPVETLIPERFRAAHEKHRARYMSNPVLRPMGTGLDLYGRRADGTEFPVDISLSVAPGPQGPLVVAVVRDVTERRRAEERLAAQNAVLQRIATSEPLTETLESICRLIERDRAGAVCAILALDSDVPRLRLRAGAGLPASLRRLLDSVPVGMRFGPCGAAAKAGTPVAVRDFARDGRWKRLARAALASGLRSCVSVPVRSAAGESLGVIAVFGPQPLERADASDGLLEVAANLARIAFEHELADRELEESRRRLETLVDNLPGMVYRCHNDRDWTMEWVSRGSLPLTGYAPADLVRGRVVYGELIDPEDRDRVWDEVQEALAERRAFQLGYRIETRDGQRKWVWERGRGVYDGSGHLVALEGFVVDVTANRKAEEERARLAEILEATTDIVATADADGRLRYLNAAGRRLLGIEPDADLASLKAPLPDQLRTLLNADATTAAAQDGVWRGENVVLARDGQEIPVSQVVVAHRRADASVEFFSTIARDISEQKRFEAQLLHAANHDPLTGLANRQRFEEDLERELARLRAAGGQAALLFLDLDDFKAVNDSLGHRAGDEALASLADFLSSQARPLSVVARVGGD